MAWRSIYGMLEGISPQRSKNAKLKQSNSALPVEGSTLWAQFPLNDACLSIYFPAMSLPSIPMMSIVGFTVCVKINSDVLVRTICRLEGEKPAVVHGRAQAINIGV